MKKNQLGTTSKIVSSLTIPLNTNTAGVDTVSVSDAFKNDQWGGEKSGSRIAGNASDRPRQRKVYKKFIGSQQVSEQDLRKLIVDLTNRVSCEVQ